MKAVNYELKSSYLHLKVLQLPEDFVFHIPNRGFTDIDPQRGLSPQTPIIGSLSFVIKLTALPILFCFW